MGALVKVSHGITGITGKFSIKDIITKGTCRTFAEARGVAFPSSQSKNPLLRNLLAMVSKFSLCVKSRYEAYSSLWTPKNSSTCELGNNSLCGGTCDKFYDRIP